MKSKKKIVKAQLLTPIQLKMLDAGQPIVVTCETPSGASVEVRLQTAILDSDPKSNSKGHSKGCWLHHGVYVAVLSEIEEKSKTKNKSAQSSASKGYTTLPLGQMYRLLRGLPGKLRSTSSSGEKYTVTYFNPNAPANRCYETKGLCISLEASTKTAEKNKKKLMSKELTSQELKTLRNGKALELTFGERVLTLQSNTGGQLVQLPHVRTN